MRSYDGTKQWNLIPKIVLLHQETTAREMPNKKNETTITQTQCINAVAAAATGYKLSLSLSLLEKPTIVNSQYVCVSYYN